MRPRLFLAATALSLLLILPLAGCNGGEQGTAPGPSPNGNKSVTENKKAPATNQAELERREKSRQLLQDIEKLARAGKVPGCPYAVKTSVTDDLEKAWGKPDKTEYIAAAKGTFATYKSHNIVIGSNKGMQIFDIRSYDPALKVIKPSDLARVYGPAAITRSFDSQQMIGYVVSDEFRLRFIFPAGSKDNPDPGLDHLALLYPAGSVNSMADDPGVQW